MASLSLRTIVSHRPMTVVGAWVVLAAAVGLLAPNLTRIAAEGQAKLLPSVAESRLAAKVVRDTWPEQAYESLAVAALYRPSGLTEADRAFARRLSARLESPGRPREVLRVLGPGSAPEIARRLESHDRTVSLVAVPLSTAFVLPVTQQVVGWLQEASTDPALAPPSGLELRWTGDAVIGRDYMAKVQTSLDRAAAATVVLLLVVLLVVYRSFWLALVPLVTIGVSLVVARGVLGWMASAGWEISPLVELFLVAVLFGCGTDFCLFLSWRFAENFDADDPAGAMDRTQRCSALALLTSAGTVVIGLSLMGTTKFKLFSSTGPSVAIGLALTLLATLTLAPALLVLLARLKPKAFQGITAEGSQVWERLGASAMKRPLLSWVATVLLMAPFALVGMRTHLLQDLLSEMPASTPSAQGFRLLGAKFEQGQLAPLTVVLESPTDLRTSEGLALIDDVSRFLNRQRRLIEVRSATQPLGTPETLRRARLDARVGEVNAGLGKMAAGASELQRGLYEGVAKLRAAIWLEHKTGVPMTSGTAPPGESHGDDETALPRTQPEPRGTAREALFSGLKRARSALVGTGTGFALTWSPTAAENLDGHPAAPASTPTSPAAGSAPVGSAARGDDRREVLVAELSKAADGAKQLAEGAALAGKEVTAILKDPVGRRALDRLMLNNETVRAHPELTESFAMYLSKDGRRARIDLTQADRLFSGAAMDHVDTIRRRLAEYLSDSTGPPVTATIAGTNAESADVRALTRSDQFQSWFVIPIGVFLVLLVALRDPLVCLNLVATMLLTYAFALGATHLVFVVGLGAEGIDWKVPYFLFVLLVAVGVDYNVFLMARLREETGAIGLRPGIVKAIGQTGGLITSAAAITACSFASFLSSPLGSLRQLGFALVIGLTVDALLVRPLLVPCGHWLLTRHRTTRPRDAAAPGSSGESHVTTANRGRRRRYVAVAD